MRQILRNNGHRWVLLAGLALGLAVPAFVAQQRGAQDKPAPPRAERQESPENLLLTKQQLAQELRQELREEIRRLRQELKLELKQDLRQELRQELRSELKQELKFELRQELGR